MSFSEPVWFAVPEPTPPLSSIPLPPKSPNESLYSLHSYHTANSPGRSQTSNASSDYSGSGASSPVVDSIQIDDLDSLSAASADDFAARIVGSNTSKKGKYETIRRRVELEEEEEDESEEGVETSQEEDEVFSSNRDTIIYEVRHPPPTRIKSDPGLPSLSHKELRYALGLSFSGGPREYQSFRLDLPSSSEATRSRDMRSISADNLPSQVEGKQEDGGASDGMGSAVKQKTSDDSFFVTPKPSFLRKRPSKISVGPSQPPSLIHSPHLSPQNEAILDYISVNATVPEEPEYNSFPSTEYSSNRDSFSSEEGRASSAPGTETTEDSLALLPSLLKLFLLLVSRTVDVFQPPILLIDTALPSLNLVKKHRVQQDEKFLELTKNALGTAIIGPRLMALGVWCWVMGVWLVAKYARRIIVGSGRKVSASIY